MARAGSRSQAPAGGTENGSADAPPVGARPTQRDELFAYMTATATGRFGWIYDETRPLAVPPVLAHGVVGDCSFGLVVLCAWAGLADPTGGAYDGWGNSRSIFHHLPHIRIARGRVGDIVLFGVEGRDHAAMIYAPAADPLLWSFGHQGAPNLYPLSADRRTPVTVCRIAAA
jgi:hypothetical protein